METSYRVRRKQQLAFGSWPLMILVWHSRPRLCFCAVLLFREQLHRRQHLIKQLLIFRSELLFRNMDLSAQVSGTQISMCVPMFHDLTMRVLYCVMDQGHAVLAAVLRS